MTIPKVFALSAALLVPVASGAAEVTVTNNPEQAQYEQLFQRYLKQMRDVYSNAPPGMDFAFVTNCDTPEFRETFKRMFVVHPSFGLGWDEVPAPTTTDTNAMKGVEDFVATNGWNMCTNFLSFVTGKDQSKVIRGLPWEVIQNREFPAITRNGILYVTFGGFGISKWGVAYNPKTNDFGGLAFKHLGQHWYAWILPDDGNMKVQQYEGAKR